MITWLIVGAYAIGYLLTARMVALNMIEGEASVELERREGWRNRFSEPHSDDGKPLVDGEERVLSLLMGCIAAIIWPVVLLVIGIAGSLRSPSERLAEQRHELEALRKLAREHNLPMPGGDA